MPRLKKGENAELDTGQGPLCWASLRRLLLAPRENSSTETQE